MAESTPRAPRDVVSDLRTQLREAGITEDYSAASELIGLVQASVDANPSDRAGATDLTRALERRTSGLGEASQVAMSLLAVLPSDAEALQEFAKYRAYKLLDDSALDTEALSSAHAHGQAGDVTAARRKLDRAIGGDSTGAESSRERRALGRLLREAPNEDETRMLMADRIAAEHIVPGARAGSLAERSQHRWAEKMRDLASSLRDRDSSNDQLSRVFENARISEVAVELRRVADVVHPASASFGPSSTPEGRAVVEQMLRMAASREPGRLRSGTPAQRRKLDDLVANAAGAEQRRRERARDPEGYDAERSREAAAAQRAQDRNDPDAATKGSIVQRTPLVVSGEQVGEVLTRARGVSTRRYELLMPRHEARMFPTKSEAIQAAKDTLRSGDVERDSTPTAREAELSSELADLSSMTPEDLRFERERLRDEDPVANREALRRIRAELVQREERRQQAQPDQAESPNESPSASIGDQQEQEPPPADLQTQESDADAEAEDQAEPAASTQATKPAVEAASASDNHDATEQAVAEAADSPAAPAGHPRPRGALCTDEELEATREKVAKINRRAEKKGFTGRLEVESEPFERTTTNQLGFNITEVLNDVRITGEAPRYADADGSSWQFIAKLDFDDAGVIVRTAPGVDTIDREQIRDRWCDECQSKRQRKGTFLVRNEATDEMRQVGSSCIKNFLGWKTMPVFLSDEDVEVERNPNPGVGERRYSTKTVLAVAWSCIKATGGYQRSSDGGGTARQVRTVLNPFTKADNEFAEEIRPFVADSEEMAEKVRAFILSDDFAGDSEYVRNLKVIANADSVSPKNFGFLVSAPQAWARHQERTLFAQRERAETRNEHYGQVGEKVRLQVQVKGVNWGRPTYYGGVEQISTIYTLISTEGHVFKWFSSSEALGDEPSDTLYTITGTIKAHDEYEGRKQTRITRCRVVDEQPVAGRESESVVSRSVADEQQTSAEPAEHTAVAEVPFQHTRPLKLTATTALLVGQDAIKSYFEQQEYDSRFAPLRSRLRMLLESGDIAEDGADLAWVVGKLGEIEGRSADDVLADIRGESGTSVLSQRDVAAALATLQPEAVATLVAGIGSQDAASPTVTGSWSSIESRVTITSATDGLAVDSGQGSDVVTWQEAREWLSAGLDEAAAPVWLKLTDALPRLREHSDLPEVASALTHARDLAAELVESAAAAHTAGTPRPWMRPATELEVPWSQLQEATRSAQPKLPATLAQELTSLAQGSAFGLDLTGSAALFTRAQLRRIADRKVLPGAEARLTWAIDQYPSSDKPAWSELDGAFHYAQRALQASGAHPLERSALALARIALSDPTSKGIQQHVDTVLDFASQASLTGIATCDAHLGLVQGIANYWNRRWNQVEAQDGRTVHVVATLKRFADTARAGLAEIRQARTGVPENVESRAAVEQRFSNVRLVTGRRSDAPKNSAANRPVNGSTEADHLLAEMGVPVNRWSAFDAIITADDEESLQAAFANTERMLPREQFSFGMGQAIAAAARAVHQQDLSVAEARDFLARWDGEDPTLPVTAPRIAVGDHVMTVTRRHQEPTGHVVLTGEHEGQTRRVRVDMTGAVDPESGRVTSGEFTVLDAPVQESPVSVAEDATATAAAADAYPDWEQLSAAHESMGQSWMRLMEAPYLDELPPRSADPAGHPSFNVMQEAWARLIRFDPATPYSPWGDTREDQLLFVDLVDDLAQATDSFVRDLGPDPDAKASHTAATELAGEVRVHLDRMRATLREQETFAAHPWDDQGQQAHADEVSATQYQDASRPAVSEDAMSEQSSLPIEDTTSDTAAQEDVEVASAWPEELKALRPAETFTDAHQAALAWYDNGFSVTAIEEGGSKKSAWEWTTYRDEARASRETIDNYWRRNPGAGIGLICGAISGNAELIEFEGRAIDEGLFEAFSEQLRATAPELLEQVINQGTLVRSPSNGLHILVRVTDGAEGNVKLAQREARDDELTDKERDRWESKGVWPRRVLAETRGQGGYVVGAGTSGRVHATGRPWELINGGPSTVPTITGQQRDLLHGILHTLDQIPLPPAPESASRDSAVEAGDRRYPGEDFKARATWEEILEPHGWERVYGRSDRAFWRRPGKTNLNEHSAVTGGSKGDAMWVFSTSSELPPEQSLNKFAVYAYLEHQGDFPKAAAVLRERGYGSPLPPRHLTLRFTPAEGVVLFGTQKYDNITSMLRDLRASGQRPGRWVFDDQIANGTEWPGAWRIQDANQGTCSRESVESMATMVTALRGRGFDVDVELSPADIDPAARGPELEQALGLLGIPVGDETSARAGAAGERQPEQVADAEATERHEPTPGGLASEPEASVDEVVEVVPSRPDWSEAVEAAQPSGTEAAVAEPDAVASEPDPAQVDTSARELVLHHSQRYGLMLIGTVRSDAIGETLRMARLQGHSVGNWTWSSSALTPTGQQGAWTIEGSQGRLATERTVRLLHTTSHALQATGVPVRVDLAPSDASENGQAALRQNPFHTQDGVSESSAASVPTTSDPVVRRWSADEVKQWADVRDKRVVQDSKQQIRVEAAEINDRWTMRIQVRINGHHLDLCMSLRDEERAVDLATSVTRSERQTLVKLAHHTVMLGEGDAALDGRRISPGVSRAELKRTIAEPGPYAPQTGEASRTASNALSASSTRSTARPGTHEGRATPTPGAGVGPPSQPQHQAATRQAVLHARTP